MSLGTAVRKSMESWVGNFLGFVGIAGLFFLDGRLISDVLQIWHNPPVKAYSIWYILVVFVPLLMGLLPFHAPLGGSKAVRILVGVMAIIGIYFGAAAYAMSWASEIGYHPMLKVDVSDLGGAEYGSQTARSALTLPLFGLMVGLCILLYSIFHAKNFWKQYFAWRLGDFMNFNFGEEGAKDDALDITLCVDEGTRKPVTWYEVDQPTNLGIFGPVGSGKTTQILIPILAQFLLKKRAGIFLIEPKGDFVDEMEKRAKEANRPYYCIDPGNSHTAVFNLLSGDDPDRVASVNEKALQASFGAQENFFKLNMGVIAKNIILLLKFIKGNDCDYMDLARCLRDESLTKGYYQRLAKALPEGIDENDPRANLCHWFKTEFFGPNAAKLREFTIGLRIHIEGMLSNRYFRRCVIGESSFDLEKLIDEGKDLYISTNDGVLGDELSSMLGIILMNNYQDAVRHRGPLPPSGDARKKYKMSILCADEFAGYVNDEFGSFISKARGYGVISILAMQSTSQLLEVGRGNNRAFQTKVLGQLRSKVIFGGLGFVDAKYFSDEFGKQEEEMVSEQTSVSRGRFNWIIPENSNEGERTQLVEKEIFNPTEIMYLPANQVFYRVMNKRSLQMPRIGLVDWFNREVSNIGSVYWFDEKEFHRMIEEQSLIGAPNGQGLARLWPWSKKEVEESKGDPKDSQESQIVDVGEKGESAFRYSSEGKMERIDSSAESLDLKIEHKGAGSSQSQGFNPGWELPVESQIEQAPSVDDELIPLERVAFDADDILGNDQ